MGKGKFIIENAVMYPDINFIGIENTIVLLLKDYKKFQKDLII